jgi:hypothetical protein
MIEQRASRVTIQPASARPDLADRPDLAAQPDLADLADLDQQIARARSDKESAIDAGDFDGAAVLRSVEHRLIAVKAAREQDTEPQDGAA